MDENSEHLRDLVRRWKLGDVQAGDQLFALIQDDLGRLARRVLAGNRDNVSLSTQDFVNEAYLKIFNLSELDAPDRAHFMALCAQAMRHALIDHLRKKNRAKRRHQKVTITISGEPASSQPRVDLMSLEHALRRLQSIDPNRAKIVELRYFGGMSIDDIAEALGVSRSTVKRSWDTSRHWLKAAIENDL